MKKAHEQAALIDEARLQADIAALFPQGAPEPGRKLADRRPEVLALLKEALVEGRAEARRRLIAERSGHRCAIALSALTDTLIRVITNHTVSRVFKVDNPSSSEHMSVIATGGYGRGLMAPGSDLDLLFLLPYKQTAWGESVVEYVLYLLWDLGLKVGHATRRVEECIRLSKSDMTIRTAVLESRFIWGSKPLFEDLMKQFDAEVITGTSAEFIRAKLAERDDRHKRQGASRYLVEPNVKEAKGGLRDLHTLFWIAKYHYRVRSSEELVQLGVFSRAEAERFSKCEDFLWAVRCHLHFISGRAEDRLSFEMQREIAPLLGYVPHPGLSVVERFMKHYFLVAKDVGALTRIFSAALELSEVKQAPGLSLLSRFTRRKKTTAHKVIGDFVIDHDRLSLADDKVFERDPINFLRFFQLMDRHDLLAHPDALKVITRSLTLVNKAFRESREANEIFLDILTSKKNLAETLRAMNEVGLLGKFLPEFGKIVALMQFNMYHHFTVDEHTIRAMGILSEIDRGEGGNAHPLANDLMRSIKSKRPLYLAMLAHDIAKGRPEDHSIAGARVVRELGKRFELTAAEIDTAAWLVEQHLTMSMVAQSRDLNDRQTIKTFAGVVQTLERLKMLLILTVADISAVGPGVFNGWKAQLLRTLYYETEPYLLGGHSQLSRDQRIAAAKRELENALSDWPAKALKTCMERHYGPYWVRVDLQDKIAHALLLRDAVDKPGHLVTHVALKPKEGVTAITIVAPDHPRLLSTIAGACTVAGGNIVDAQIFTTTDGLALDTIVISREFENDEDELRRAERISRLIEATLEGRERLPESVAKKAAQKKSSKAFIVPSEVKIDNEISADFTVLEISGLDRPGLLFGLTNVISDLSLNIATAHIATFGERAVDVFYVTDLTGGKVISGQRQSRIRRRLMSTMEPDVTEDSDRPAQKRAAGGK